MIEGLVSVGPGTTATGPPNARTAPNSLLGSAHKVRPVGLGLETCRDSRERERGQGLVEYGLILVISAVVCLVALVFFGDQISSFLQLIAGAV